MVRTDTWLDSVASIKHITSQGALFTFKDGTARRLPVIPGNRFLYFANGKMEMGKFESVEFVEEADGGTFGAREEKRRNGSQSTQTGCSHYTPYAMSVVLPEWSL
jgi:hypothetical protein